MRKRALTVIGVLLVLGLPIVLVYNALNRWKTAWENYEHLLEGSKDIEIE